MEYNKGYTCSCCRDDWEERKVWETKPEAIAWVKNELFYFATPEASLFAPDPKPEAFERLCRNAHCLCQEARKSDYTGPYCFRDAYRTGVRLLTIYTYPLSGETLSYRCEFRQDLGLTLEDLNRKD